MATFLPIRPHPVLSPFHDRIRILYGHPLLPHRTHNGCGGVGIGVGGRKQFHRGDKGVVRFGFRPPSVLDSADGAEEMIKDLFDRAEAVLYTIADAAVSSSDTVTGTKQNSDWLSGISNYMESVLKFLKDGLSGLHVPYAYGFAIILLTVLVKAATFPLTKKQVESTMAMRSLQPQIKAIQQQYAGNQERIQLETARLYKLAGINPLAGCLPTLATIPVWIGLYRALSNVANEGLLTEGFFWIPSLAGPTTVTARQSGSGVSWLFPFVDGHPPLGWHDTFAYLVLPILLVVSQYISVQIMQSSQGNDPNMKSSQALTKILPLMIGYFSLSVPSGLSLYWLTNNILSTAQQVWLQKLGGAENPVMQFTDDILKEEQPNVQKSALQANTRKEVPPKREEKLTLEGPRPGERFKQLKEQEARRKQQREEEEKRKVEEAAASGNQITNEEHNKEAPLVEREHVAGDDLTEERNKSIQSATTIRDSTTNGTIVNGNYSSQDLKNGQETRTTLGRENYDLSNNSKVDARDEQLSSLHGSQSRLYRTRRYDTEAIEVYTIDGTHSSEDA